MMGKDKGEKPMDRRSPGQQGSIFIREVTCRYTYIRITTITHLIAFEVHLCTIFYDLDLKPQLFVCFLRNFHSDSDTYSGFYHTEFELFDFLNVGI